MHLYLQVSRRLQHRSLLIFHIPSLLSLDGVMVTSEEKHVAQMMFGSDSEAQVHSQLIIMMSSYSNDVILLL